MTDIVERLRHTDLLPVNQAVPLMREAADLIERQADDWKISQATIENQRAEIERLRAVLKAFEQEMLVRSPYRRNELYRLALEARSLDD